MDMRICNPFIVMKHHSKLLNSILLISPEMDETPTRIAAVHNIRNVLSHLSGVRLSSELILQKNCDISLPSPEFYPSLSQFLDHHLCFFVTTEWERRAPIAFVDLLDQLSQHLSSANLREVLMEQVIVLVLQEPDNFLRNDWSTTYREEYLKAAFSFLNIKHTVFLKVPFNQENQNNYKFDEIAQIVRDHYKV